MADVLAYAPERWESFAVAQVGASAALAGLVVVAASINLERIIALPAVVTRLAATLSLFTAVLIASSMVLIPGQSVRWLGVELTAIAVALLPGVMRRSAWSGLEPEYRKSAGAMVALSCVAAACLLVAGVSCLSQTGGGLYWLAGATLLAYCVGLVNAWVAMVEILR